MQNGLNTHEKFGNCFDEDLLNFYRDSCADYSDFEEVKEKIGPAEVRSNPGFKISKFTLQIYAFVYQRLMDFPSGRFNFETLSTLSLFESVHRVINVKIKIYIHDFSNMNVRENQTQFSCITHNFFGFNVIFLLKGIRLLVWGTKDVNIGGSGLTNIIYAS